MLTNLSTIAKQKLGWTNTVVIKQLMAQGMDKLGAISEVPA
jgi:hypothetical protein